MMSFNPELQRNIWLQMSWSRLLVAPLLIGILLAAVIATVSPPPGVMAEAARWFFMIFIAFYDTGDWIRSGRREAKESQVPVFAPKK